METGAARGREFDGIFFPPDLTLPIRKKLSSKNSDTLVRAEMLPRTSREVLILRELEGMSYKEIANAGHAIGTVMSSLSRARGRFVKLWQLYE
jgi:DNA-directed RNA polymerase specialized sigma24 family protein